MLKLTLNVASLNWLQQADFDLSDGEAATQLS